MDSKTKKVARPMMLETRYLARKLANCKYLDVALEMIDDTFSKELGAQSDNSFILEVMSKDRKPDLTLFVNTTDKDVLYPELKRLCLEDAKVFSKGKQEKVKYYLDAFKWQRGKDSTPEPQQGEHKQQKNQQQKPQNGEVVLPDVLDTQKTQVIFDEAKDSTPEPQQGEHKQQKNQQQKPQNGEVVLPDVLNTQETQVIFDEAIIRGWMQPNGMGGYKWLGLKDWERGTQQQCVYMIGQMYGYKKGDSGNDGNNIPCKALEKLFGIGGIYSRLIKCWETKNPQAWRQAIDEMIATALQKITASTSN